jgi:hypothetical protein
MSSHAQRQYGNYDFTTLGVGTQPSSIPSWSAVMSHSSELTLKNAELLHHYVTAASSSLADYDSFRPVWQVSVPQEAQSFGFLMDGILAISALHLGSIYYSPTLTSSESQALPYHELAQRHYNTAVCCFNNSVKQLTSANTNAVLAFAHLTVYFAFGSSPVLPSTCPSAVAQGRQSPSNPSMTFWK